MVPPKHFEESVFLKNSKKNAFGNGATLSNIAFGNGALPQFLKLPVTIESRHILQTLTHAKEMEPLLVSFALC